MISDKERREVASGIRRFLSVPYDERIWECDGLQTVGRLVETPVGENILARLADLIDRPTCRNVSGYKDTFECSECGYKIGLIAEVCNEHSELLHMPLMPLRCPNCKAEVVE